jgi:hypothetical protein
MVATSQIKEHMEVIGSDGAHVGTVDHMQGENRIKLTKSDSPDGMHHFIPLDWVDRVDQHVHLTKAADEAMEDWDDEDSMELEDEGAGQMAGSIDEDEDAKEASESEKNQWADERR